MAPESGKKRDKSKKRDVNAVVKLIEQSLIYSENPKIQPNTTNNA